MSSEARDHPSLADYPNNPTSLYTDEDGVTWRVPLARDKDEAVPVPVTDLAEARTAIAQLRFVVEQGELEDWRLELIGVALASTTTNDPNPPRTRAEVARAIEDLRQRVQHWLPYW